MGKLKQVGIWIGITVFIFFALVAIDDFMTPDSETSVNNSLTSKIDYDKMSISELALMSVDWNYRDILRDIDNYENDIIFVDGTVTKIHRDLNSINLCINPGDYSCDDFIFVNVDENKWLEDDKLSGFVEVNRLEETGSSNMFTGEEWVGSGNYVPRVSEIRLICSNC